LDEAARLGIHEADGEESTIRALLAQEVRTPQPDEAACRRYHAANRARFRSPDLYEAAHILLAGRARIDGLALDGATTPLVQ
jgi:peptidyl-prolyl cis-trans isomerase C